VWVRRTASLAALLIVFVSRTTCRGDLRAGIACRAALDVALSGLDLSLDGSGGDSGWESEGEGGDEEEDAREELHDCGLGGG
jgi:hypothetical protein